VKPLARFLFDTSFDHEEPPAPRLVQPVRETPEPEPEPAAPSFGEADLARARQEGFAEGQTQAAAAARASIEQNAADALAVLAAGLPELAAGADAGLAASTRLMVETALAGLRRMMPELNRRGGLAEIEGLLERTVTDLRNESRIVVRLNEQLLEPLRDRLDRVAQSSGFEGRIVLLADEEMPIGDCRVEWADGGVERMTARVWNDIEAAVMRALSMPAEAASAKETHTTATGAPQAQEI